MSHLYSFRGSYPAPLPFRLIMPGGRTRTDPTTFTSDEIEAAGYSGPYLQPDHDPTTQALAWVNGAWTVVALPEPEPLPPEPQWIAFGLALAKDPTMGAFVSQLGSAPRTAVLERMISGGLLQAAEGNSRTFLAAWGAALAGGAVSPEMAAHVHGLAAEFDLPGEFMAGLSPAAAAEV